MEGIIRIVCGFAFLIFRLLYHIVQALFWRWNGVHDKLKLSRSKYNTSAQVLDIVWRWKLDELIQPPSRVEFIYRHNKFVDPDYVLQDHISLYYVTPSEAVFVETNPNVDVAHSSTDSFLRVAQYRHAKRLVVLPMRSFEALAEEVGDPSAKVILLNNTGRCGSTLVSQILEHTQHCVSLSEPWFLNFPVDYGRALSQTEVDGIMINCMRLQCKPQKNKKIDAFLVKPMGQHTQYAPMYARIYKNSTQLFLYRNALKTADSFYRFAQTFLITRVLYNVNRVVPLMEMLLGVKRNSGLRNLDSRSIGLYIWASSYHTYTELYKQGLDIRALRYEDFVSDSSNSTCIMLRYCELPEVWAVEGVKAMLKDSQRSSAISKDNINRKKLNMDHDMAHQICSYFNLPNINEECILDGTITYTDTKKLY